MSEKCLRIRLPILLKSHRHLSVALLKSPFLRLITSVLDAFEAEPARFAHVGRINRSWLILRPARTFTIPCLPRPAPSHLELAPFIKPSNTSPLLIQSSPRCHQTSPMTMPASLRPKTGRITMPHRHQPASSPITRVMRMHPTRHPSPSKSDDE